MKLWVPFIFHVLHRHERVAYVQLSLINLLSDLLAAAYELVLRGRTVSTQQNQYLFDTCSLIVKTNSTCLEFAGTWKHCQPTLGTTVRGVIALLKHDK